MSNLARFVGALVGRGLARLIPVEDSLEDLAEDLSREAEAKARIDEAGRQLHAGHCPTS